MVCLITPIDVLPVVACRSLSTPRHSVDPVARESLEHLQQPLDVKLNESIENIETKQFFPSISDVLNP